MFPQKISELYRKPDSHQPPPNIELAGNLEYPNLNAADLSARLENLSIRLHSCWDSISVNEHNHFALATNRRKGCEWWGVFFGHSEDNAKHMTEKNADFKLQSTHTVNIVRYAENNVLLAALGDTKLQVWSTYSKVRNPVSPYCLFMIGESAAHPSAISHLSVFKADQKMAVTASPDGTINIWNFAGADLESSYRTNYAHTDKLTGMATPVSTCDQFVTCDRGGCARIWDARAVAPSSMTLYNDTTHMISFTCAAWAGPTELQGDNYIYFGDFDGNVHTIDIRVPKKFQETMEYFDDSIISQLSINGPHLAVMSNQPAGVKIAKMNGSHEIIYTNKDTHDRLTDAVWTDAQTLLTIGHGRKMVKHIIP
ncbi:GL26675 [Drosophila persimilis]|uniref:GL26675 n=1 Tax=Drosophila persimilis TaxID=7234 RepID=B4GT75_DROPE|nr:protein valois [Drosophila persimilis]EDW25584.1 GL26675 [Drosophila persimilis]